MVYIIQRPAIETNSLHHHWTSHWICGERYEQPNVVRYSMQFLACGSKPMDVWYEVLSTPQNWWSPHWRSVPDLDSGPRTRPPANEFGSISCRLVRQHWGVRTKVGTGIVRWFRWLSFKGNFLLDTLCIERAWSEWLCSGSMASSFYPGWLYTVVIHGFPRISIMGHSNKQQTAPPEPRDVCASHPGHPWSLPWLAWFRASCRELSACNSQNEGAHVHAPWAYSTTTNKLNSKNKTNGMNRTNGMNGMNGMIQ